MTIHKLPELTDNLDLSAQHDELGETALPFAPTLSFGGEKQMVPQQYLHVRRTLESVENILARIEFSDKYPVFAGRSGSTVFIQVGLIGQENYPRAGQDPLQTKIVYGRRWMLEPTTPTSEVVQTVLLALKKAREHELREKLFVQINDGAHSATPFNNHQDLPLMAANAAYFTHRSDSCLDEVIGRMRFSSTEQRVVKITPLADQLSVVELDICAGVMPEALFPELVDQRLTIVCDPADANSFMHALLGELIQLSDRFVDENFRFDGFARFSQSVSLLKIADFSYQTRNVKAIDDRFDDYFVDMSYEVDAARAPHYSTGELGESQRLAVQRAGVESGYLPYDPVVEGQRKAEPKLRRVSS